MEKTYNPFFGLEKVVGEIIKTPTPYSYFQEEDKMLLKMIDESNKLLKEVSISEETLYKRFSI